MEHLVISITNQSHNEISRHYFYDLFELAEWVNDSMVKHSAYHTVMTSSSKGKLDYHLHLMSYEVAEISIYLRDVGITAINDSFQPFREKVIVSKI